MLKKLNIFSCCLVRNIKRILLSKWYKKRIEKVAIIVFEKNNCKDRLKLMKILLVSSLWLIQFLINFLKKMTERILFCISVRSIVAAPKLWMWYSQFLYELSCSCQWVLFNIRLPFLNINTLVSAYTKCAFQMELFCWNRLVIYHEVIKFSFEKCVDVFAETWREKSWAKFRLFNFWIFQSSIFYKTFLSTWNLFNEQ